MKWGDEIDGELISIEEAERKIGGKDDIGTGITDSETEWQLTIDVNNSKYAG